MLINMQALVDQEVERLQNFAAGVQRLERELEATRIQHYIQLGRVQMAQQILQEEQNEETGPEMDVVEAELSTDQSSQAVAG